MGAGETRMDAGATEMEARRIIVNMVQGIRML